MNLKTEITEKVLNTLGVSSDPKTIKKIIPVWWQNPRTKDNGGLRLTERGFKSLENAGIKFYEIRIEEPLKFSNQLIIWIDRFIDCPFYLTSKSIFVTTEKMAIQLILYAGNIHKFTLVKAKKYSQIDKNSS